jgi:hypothetical protein
MSIDISHGQKAPSAQSPGRETTIFTFPLHCSNAHMPSIKVDERRLRWTAARFLSVSVADILAAPLKSLLHRRVQDIFLV